MNPKYPIYVVSKGRADTRLTAKALESMGVPYSIVIEEQEYDQYAAVINPQQILILDKSYQKQYDTCDDLGETKSKGPGAARNFAWEHSINAGHHWHWVMDDNIARFFRLNKNLKVPAPTGSIFRAMEDFVERYNNVLMAGPNYFMFASRKSKARPFTPNTRIYSCNLIRNDAPYRWRGRYNEDTDLSLRMLKDGFCTILFNAFLQEKTVTQKLAGGCTTEFYAVEGTIPKSRMQAKLHPDVSRVTFKFGRWHHEVDYRPFKGNKLIRRTDIDWENMPKVDNYGMKLVKARI